MASASRVRQLACFLSPSTSKTYKVESQESLMTPGEKQAGRNTPTHNKKHKTKVKHRLLNVFKKGNKKTKQATQESAIEEDTIASDLEFTGVRRLFQEVDLPSPPTSSIPASPAIKSKDDSISSQNIKTPAATNVDNQIINTSVSVNQLSYDSSSNKISHPTEDVKQTQAEQASISEDNLKTDEENHLSNSEVKPVSPEDMESKPKKLRSTATTSPTTPDVRVGTIQDSSTPTAEPVTGPLDRNLDSVFGDLDLEESSRHDVAPNYHDLLSEIAELLVGDEDMIAPLYCLSPKDPRKLLIQGPRVTKWKDKISILRDKYNFETVVSEEEPVMTTTKSKLPIYTKVLDGNDPPKMPYHLHKRPFTPDEVTDTATIGVFVKDDRMIRRKLICGVTAAHAILDREEQNALAEWDANPDAIKARIDATCAARTTRGSEYGICPHNHSPIYTNDMILVAYNNMIPTPEYGQDQLKPFMKFACDIALVQVRAEEIDRNIVGEAANESFLSTHISHQSVDHIDRPLKQTPIAGYINIQTPEDIEKLRQGRVKIIVCGVVGELQRQPETFTQATIRPLTVPSAANTIRNRSVQRNMIPSHFAFTTQKALYHGQSGAPVFVHDKTRDVLYIIGLLMGSFKGASEWCQDLLYQAMPFSPALQLMEFVYDQKLKNIRPVTSESSVLTADDSVQHLSSHPGDTGSTRPNFSLDTSCD